MPLRPVSDEFEDIAEGGDLESIIEIDQVMEDGLEKAAVAPEAVSDVEKEIPVEMIMESVDEIAIETAIGAESTTYTDWTGWVLLWKPQGVTSFDCIRWIKSALRGLPKPRPKIGHTGTLDPFAEGLLLVALGGATRLIPLLEDWPKTYRATCLLGRETDTLDPEGTVVREAPIPTLTREQIEAVFPQFMGSIWQTPPIYSALKQGGEALYKKARRGEQVEVPPRLVHIDRLTLLEVGEDRFEFEVVCGGGTYIRSLCRDLAAALGTASHCGALQRTGLNLLTGDNAWHVSGPEEIDIESLHGQMHPPDAPLEDLPWLSVGNADAVLFAHGNQLSAEEFQDGEPGVDLLRRPIRVYDADGFFLGVAILETAAAPFVLQPKVVLAVPSSE